MSTPRVISVSLVALLAAASASAIGPAAVEVLGRTALPVEVEALGVVRAELESRQGSLSPDAVLLPAGVRSLAGGRARIASVREEVEGVPVFRGKHRLVLDAENRVRGFLPGHSAVPGLPGPFLIDAAQAVVLADAALAGEVPPRGAWTPGAVVSATERSEKRGGWSLVDLPGLPDTAWARRVVMPDGPTAAWQVELPERGSEAERWMVFVDATAGTELKRISRTQDAAASGRVYPKGAMYPSEIVSFVDGDVVLDPASPRGWLNADQTEGNNCYSWDDRLGDGGGTPGLYATGIGDPLRFDFPVTGVPVDDLDAALTNAFWAVNWAHDRLWHLGFNEAAGNMQAENFGRGGRGGDRVRVSVQYRSTDGTVPYNRSFTSTNLGDGQFSQLLFGLWDISGEMRDGALDTGLIYHEMGHLVSLRSLGPDGACDDGAQPDGLAEGWGDYFAASFTGDTVIGAYVSGDTAVGLRTRALDQVPYTYLNLCNISAARCIDTDNGEIWAATLWDLRENLIEDLGPEEGVERTDRLVVEGMQFTTCPPTFLDARDGILMADLLLHEGRDHCAIWRAMAGRGMGDSATTTGPADALPIPGFDLPLECIGGAGLSWERADYGDDADARLLLGDEAAEGLERSVEVSTSGGDSELFVSPAGPAARWLEIPIRPGAAPVPGDGVLEVLDGETLTATCTDCAGSPTSEAGIRKTMAVFYRSHDLRDETCDTDDEPRFDQPPLLDAGEYARLRVTFGNGERFPLEDVRLTMSCDHPGITFLPTQEIRLGDIHEGTGASWPFTIDFYVEADAGIAFGEMATFTWDFTSRGHQARTSVTVPLAADYLQVVGAQSWGGTETFEPGSPTVRDWVHEPAGGLPADLWGVVPCGDGGGRAMAYQGQPGVSDCTEHADDDAAARLISPPLFPPGLAAVEPTSISWRNDVDLGRDPRTLYCDADAVILYLTDDPDRPNFARPRDDRNGSVQWWAQLTAFSDERNTDGWVDAVPQQTIDDRDVAGMDLSQVRLWWYFFTDIYNEADSGGCRSSDPDAVGLGYYLDNVTVTYDAVQLIEQDPAMTCEGRPCFTRAHLVITGDDLPCTGDDLFLDATGSEAVDCPNGLFEYRFTGPGFDTGYGPELTATAPAADGNWSARIRCVEDTGCTHTATIAVTTLDDSQAGRVRAGSLRAMRDGDDVRLWWFGTRAPEAYAVFRADADRFTRLAQLSGLAADPPDSAFRAGSPVQRSYTDLGWGAPGGAEISFYRVVGRDPCSGEPALQ